MTTDQHAEHVLAYLVLPVSRHIRDGDIDAAWNMLANTRGRMVREALMIAAAMFDPDQPRERLLGWWEHGMRPATVEHADEWPWDTPPLRPEVR